MKIDEQKTSGTSFQDFLEKINRTDSDRGKQILADEFINKLDITGYPVFEDDSTVILLYKGNAENVEIIGDMTNWEKSVPLKKIEGTELFYYRNKFEPAARLEYWFMFSKDGFPFLDSLNEFKSVNGLGELSELTMPGYIRHHFFGEYERGKKGDYSGLQKINLHEGILPYEHTIHIYLPPGYNEKTSYPVVYFQDGRDYIECAVTPHILDELINAEEIKPVIAVFVTPPNLHQPEMPNRMTEYGLNDDYVEFFTKELVQFIDSKYSTEQNPGSRLVIGDSFGGLISTYISFKYSDVFGKAYSQSGYFSFSKDKLIKLFSSLDRKSVKLFVDVGTYERNVGASFLPDEETDFLEANRRLKKVLEEKEYDFIYREYFEGHTWGNWRRHLIDALIYFFGIKS